MENAVIEFRAILWVNLLFIMELKHSVCVDWQSETSFGDRMTSFHSCEIPYHHKIGLAKSGFQYTGNEDLFQCMDCHGRCQIWRVQQNPYEDHLKFWPNCIFIQQTESIRYTAISPEYEQLPARRKTFRTWPESKMQSPNSFAAAGFYHIGPLDRVRCFSCGIALKEWGSEDDPVAVHKTVCPHCVYIHGSSLQLMGISLAAGAQSADSDVIRDNISEENVTSSGEHLLSYNASDSTLQMKRTNPLFQTMLNLGFDEEAILQEMRIRILKTGQNFVGVNEFLDTVWKRERFIKTGALQANAHISNADHLVEENTHLRERLSCKICRRHGQRASVMFLPCGHLVACTQCADTLNICSVCQTNIKGTVSVHRF